MRSYVFKLLLVTSAIFSVSPFSFAKSATEDTELSYLQFNAKPDDTNEEFHTGATRTFHITSASQLNLVLQVLAHQGQHLPSNTVINVLGWKESATQTDVQIVAANDAVRRELPNDLIVGDPEASDPATQVATFLAASFANVDLTLVEAPPVEEINTPLAYPSSASLDFWLTATAGVVSGVTYYNVFTYEGASPSLTLLASAMIGVINAGVQYVTPSFAVFINKPAKFGKGIVNKLASFMKTQSRRALFTVPIISFVYAMKFFTGMEVWEPNMHQVWETAQNIGIDSLFFLGSTGFAIEALKVHDARDGQPLSEKSAMIYKWAFLSITLLGRFAQFCDASDIPIGPVVYGGMLVAGAGALTAQKVKFPSLMAKVRKYFMGAAASCMMAFSAATADPLFQKGVEPESPVLP